MHKFNNLVLYRKILEDNIVKKVISLLKLINEDNYEQEVLENLYFEICADLINKVEEYNLSGDLWKEYVLNLILDDENVFSLNCEKYGDKISEDLFKLAVRDIEILKRLYNVDWMRIREKLGIEKEEFIHNCSHLSVDKPVNKLCKNRISELKLNFSTDISTDKLTNLVRKTYFSTGCGQISRYLVFRYEKNKGLLGIENNDPIELKDLVGYEYQKDILKKNTQFFLKGLKANNVLLFGDKGTGKSSSVKALVNEYFKERLRLIEISKDQLVDFKEIIKKIRNRGLYFIIFMDDLSFEDFEVEYKYMKSAIEGGIEVKPDNVLIYATSNLRHLVKENIADRNNPHGEMHMSDTEQEKLSLADRFGISLTYSAPNQDEYLKIVLELAKQNDIDIPIEDLKKKALKWELWHNGRSGRSANQFIYYLQGELDIKC